MTDDALAALDDFSPEDLDKATMEKGFRQATAMLLVGKLTVNEWRWFAVEAINDAVDLPILTETQERPIFRQGFTTVGHVLEGLLVDAPFSEDFRDATLDLLRSEATVDEWMNVAAEVVDAVVDIPYVPGVAEEVAFDRAFDLIAKALHGLLVNGSDKNE